MDRPRFTKEQKCAKCGRSDWRVKSQNDCDGLYLLYICGCGHTWQTQTADAQQEEPAFYYCPNCSRFTGCPGAKDKMTWTISCRAWTRITDDADAQQVAEQMPVGPCTPACADYITDTQGLAWMLCQSCVYYQVSGGCNLGHTATPTPKEEPIILARAYPDATPPARVCGECAYWMRHVARDLGNCVHPKRTWRNAPLHAKACPGFKLHGQEHTCGECVHWLRRGNDSRGYCRCSTPGGAPCVEQWRACVAFAPIATDPNARLLPCPWCGEAPRLLSYKTDGGRERYAISCENDDCECVAETVYFDTADQAGAAWNRRAA